MKASHNSGTGERPANLWARLFPFVARCQTKTLEEQCEAGVTLFDLRVRWYDGRLFIHHGLARYDLTLDEAVLLLDRKAKPLSVVMVTYEGECDDDEDMEAFVQVVERLVNPFYNIRLGDIAIKRPQWLTIAASPYQPAYEQNYVKIIGWRVLLPFPRLWDWWLKAKGKWQKANEENEKLSMEDFI